MLTSTDRQRSRLALDQPVVAWPRAESRRPDPVAALLDAAGAVDGLRALVIGPGGLDAACGLHGRGAAAVTLVRAGWRIRPEPADAALVPRVASDAEAAFAIGHAARALRPGGRLVLRHAPGAELALLRATRACLAQHGFIVGRTLMQAGCATTAAERPLCAPMRRAS